MDGLISTGVDLENSKMLKPLRRNGLMIHSLVGFRLLVGVIRWQNGNRLQRSRFIDYAQNQTEKREKHGVVAAQRLHVISGIFQNSSQTVVTKE